MFVDFFRQNGLYSHIKNTLENSKVISTQMTVMPFATLLLSSASVTHQSVSLSKHDQPSLKQYGLSSISKSNH